MSILKKDMVQEGDIEGTKKRKAVEINQEVTTYFACGNFLIKTVLKI